MPELVAELDRTDRDATSRSLAFCLRAIGDARAIPALIRAIPKRLRPSGSDCGVTIADPDLRSFMLAHQNHKHSNEQDTLVACGRPVNEIIPALERISTHREPPDVGDADPLRHVSLGGTAEQQAQQRALFEQRQKLWQRWWSEHWHEFVTREELQSVELPKRDQDLVEMAGLARYGVLFPTGAQVRLGPVRMLRLTHAIYWNGKSHLDFDTGRIFEQYEGMNAADWGQPAEFSSRISGWHQHNGIDIRCQGSVGGEDLELWLIDDSRWETIDAEIQKDERLRLGREATSWLATLRQYLDRLQVRRAGHVSLHHAGGRRGIVQVFPKDQGRRSVSTAVQDVVDRWGQAQRVAAGDSARPVAAASHREIAWKTIRKNRHDDNRTTGRGAGVLAESRNRAEDDSTKIPEPRRDCEHVDSSPQ